MSRTFNSFQKVTIKNAAKAVAAIRVKQDKVRKEIEKLEAKIAEFDSEIKVFEDSVTSITCGYKPRDLVAKVERESGKQSDWVFIYPDTIVPPSGVAPQQIEHPVTEEEAKEIPTPVQDAEDTEDTQLVVEEAKEEVVTTSADAEDPNGDDPFGGENYSDPFESDAPDTEEKSDNFTAEEFFN